MVQLYDLEADIAEQQNLALAMPEKVEELRQLLQTQVDRGRSTPGDSLTNDVAVKIDKKPKERKSKKKS